MASPGEGGAEYLYSRLRQHKAHNARTETSNPAALSARSSPLTSEFRRSLTSTSKGERTASCSIGSGPMRSMGAREMEEQVDKLLKQNFDLKLELYHRREKIDELDKKLLGLPMLEEDNAELLSVNEELVTELEKRDRAIDEAVAMICELEDKVSNLQICLRDALRQPFATPSAGSVDGATLRQEPQRPGVSQHTDVTGHSPAYSDTVKRVDVPIPRAGELLRPTPSFLDKSDGTSDALKSILVPSNVTIRPAPSRRSLMDRPDLSAEDNTANEFVHGSPSALSAISDSEIQSLRGRNKSNNVAKLLQFGETPVAATRGTNASHDSLPLYAQSHSHTAARMSEDFDHGRLAPATRSPGTGANRFRSLGGVLQHNIPDYPRLLQRQFTAPHILARDSGLHLTPQISVNPLSNLYPPTPDTMTTGPSNKSSSSVAEKLVLDATNRNSSRPSTAAADTRQNELPDFFSHQPEAPRYSMLPKEMDAFDLEESDPFRSREEYQPFVPGQFEPAFDGQVGTQRAQLVLASKEITLDPPARLETSPTRIFLSRRLSMDQISSPASSWHSAYEAQSNYQSTNISGQQSRTPSHKSAQSSTKDLLKGEVPAYRRIHVTSIHQSPVTPPQNTSVNDTARRSTGRLPRQAAAFRQRVSRIARRNSMSGSQSGVLTEPSEPIDPHPESAPSLRQSGITRRLFVRRISNGAPPPQHKQDAGFVDGRLGTVAAPLEAITTTSPSAGYTSRPVSISLGNK